MHSVSNSKIRKKLSDQARARANAAEVFPRRAFKYVLYWEWLHGCYVCLSGIAECRPLRLRAFTRRRLCMISYKLRGHIGIVACDAY